MKESKVDDLCHQECLPVCMFTGNMDKVQMQKTSHLMGMCMLRLVMSKDQFRCSTDSIEKGRHEEVTGRM